MERERESKEGERKLKLGRKGGGRGRLRKLTEERSERKWEAKDKVSGQRR